VNFTWFASAYDTDDVVYRLGVLVIMTGALVLAAGVPLVFDERDFRLVVTGYVIMRLALVTQWIRVAIDDAPRRGAALRFAVGVTACQVGWLSLVVVPQLWPLAWGVLLPIELLIPAWAERAARTPFRGTDLAAAVLREHGVAEADVDRVWEAIALHSSIGLAQMPSPTECRRRCSMRTLSPLRAPTSRTRSLRTRSGPRQRRLPVR
jgi:Bacterial low temperature requirement A protein (LtrA)